MAKNKKKRREQKKHHDPSTGIPAVAWVDEDGMHVMIPELMPGSDLSNLPNQFDLPDLFEDMTRRFQKQIQDSPIWDMMVTEFGQKKAEEMLQEFQALPR